MAASQKSILVMAAGTGGHVFPALAIARQLQHKGASVQWLGTRRGMENELLANSGINIHHISVNGLKGTGLVRKLLAPIMLIQALIQSMQIINKLKPDCVLGMGGFVCGPGGLAAKIAGKPLIIHEQNAVAGMTNRLLARVADCVLEAFPSTFSTATRLVHTGNPLRAEIAKLSSFSRSYPDDKRALRILILGGSQGAAAINRVIPEVVASWAQSVLPEIWHQTGSRAFEETQSHYASICPDSAASFRVVPFIANMAGAYQWADLVICRSGASTVSELAAAGLPSILIPYPHHSDQQQVHNATWLVAGGAALLLEQADLTKARLLELLVEFDRYRTKLVEMGAAARALATCDADSVIASICLEYANV